MRTKDIIEGIKYVSGDNRVLNFCLRLCHIINDTDRNWEASPHLELYYLDAFKKPKFLMIVDKRLHVYLIGEKNKGRNYDIIEIEGFTSTHMVITKSELKNRIYAASKEETKLYLPRSSVQRIAYIDPDYDTLNVPDNRIFIFNRISATGTIFNKSTWTLGADIYDAENKEYKTNAHLILKAIFEEF